MKNICFGMPVKSAVAVLLLATGLFVVSCGKKEEKPADSHEHHEGDGHDHSHDGHSHGADTAAAAQSDDPAVKLFHEVMGIHDAVMPKTDQINELRLKIKETLAKKKLTPWAKAQLTDADNKLKAANDGMNAWMSGFVPPKHEDPNEKVIPYLEAEKVKIEKVRDDMLSSILQAKTLLDNPKNFK